MFEVLYVGASGMRSQQLYIDTIAHNIANLNTAGFRGSRVSFAEVASAAGLQGAQRGAGVVASVVPSSATGELKQTNEPMNVGIEGLGFMEVLRPDGSLAYTRAGQLSVTTDGLLAVEGGWPLSARIQVPSDTRELRIDPNGRVSVLTGSEQDSVEIGQIELVAFTNPGALTAVGDNLYSAPLEAGEPQAGTPGELGLGTLRQGFIEGSNIELTDELVTLLLAQRSFELNSRVIQAADQMLSITNALYR
jgi:flagellar basal-body rod protein FlgG